MKTTGLVFKSRDYIGSAEPPATVLEDESRYGSDGAFEASGQPDWVQLPRGLWVLDFNSSTTDYVEIAAAFTQLNFTSGPFSLTAVIKIDSLAGNCSILSRGALSADGYNVYVGTGGHLYFVSNQSGANQTSNSAAAAIVVDTWYSVGFSRSGTSARIYINGADATATVGSHTDPLTSARAVKIGTYDDGTSWAFDGMIACFCIYNYALSAEQHASIFQAVRHWFGV